MTGAGEPAIFDHRHHGDLVRAASATGSGANGRRHQSHASPTTVHTRFLPSISRDCHRGGNGDLCGDRGVEIAFNAWRGDTQLAYRGRVAANVFEPGALAPPAGDGIDTDVTAIGQIAFDA